MDVVQKLTYETAEEDYSTLFLRKKGGGEVGVGDEAFEGANRDPNATTMRR